MKWVQLVKKKRFIALVFVTLMLATSLATFIQYFPASEFPPISHSGKSGGFNPALSSIGETGSSYIDTSYYTNTSVSNSGTTTVDIAILENGSFSTYSFGTSKTWEQGKTSYSAYAIQGFSGAPAYVYLTDANTIELDSMAFELGGNIYTTKQYTIETVYVLLNIVPFAKEVR